MYHLPFKIIIAHFVVYSYENKVLDIFNGKIYTVIKVNFERLFFLREEKDLTQEDMGKILNVSRVAISQWETGKEVIPLEKLNIYSNYFKVSLDYILQISNVKQYKVVNKSINPKSVGKRILYIRHKFDITQEELARQLNTTHSTISAYEAGKTLILTSFAYEIAIKYNLSLDWLLGKID